MQHGCPVAALYLQYQVYLSIYTSTQQQIFSSYCLRCFSTKRCSLKYCLFLFEPEFYNSLKKPNPNYKCSYLMYHAECV